MAGKGFEYRYRAPRNTPEERGGTPPVYSRTHRQRTRDGDRAQRGDHAARRRENLRRRVSSGR